MERQGQVGDLSRCNKDELQEMLNRQEKILLNERFVQALPDKGKKILDYVEKVRQALAALEEEEEKQASQSSIGREFQSRYQQALVRRRHTERETATEEDSTIPLNTASTISSRDALSCPERSGGTMEVAGCAEDLVEAFGRVSLFKEKTVINSPPRNSFSTTQSGKKPHYIEILDTADANITKHKFKPNRLAGSGPSSPGHSSRSATPPSAEARRQRDRKHLDDITAAKLPPLHHSPAQLLSLEESAALLQEQTRKQQVLQAKLAAQKLAEGLTVTMGNYNPEGGALGSYREVHDD